jgi:hypothetical protein
MPYRIDLAGGWLDQPYVSKHTKHGGPVVTVSIEAPDGVTFEERSGMATSTRNKAIELWGPHQLPVTREPHQLAYLLFCYENPPENIAGSQDAIGIAIPGLCSSHYDPNRYWPSRIERLCDESTLRFVEDHLALIPLGPREGTYHPLDGNAIGENAAETEPRFTRVLGGTRMPRRWSIWPRGQGIV